jgi:hypothetical protein
MHHEEHEAHEGKGWKNLGNAEMQLFLIVFPERGGIT